MIFQLKESLLISLFCCFERNHSYLSHSFISFECYHSFANRNICPSSLVLSITNKKQGKLPQNFLINPPFTQTNLAMYSLPPKYLLLLISLTISSTLGTVSWNSCITSGTIPCPTDCIASGYVRDVASNVCLAPPFTFCYKIAYVCDNTQPDYFLKACVDYGFVNNSTTTYCMTPTCVDSINACSTATTYCADQGYTNVSGKCACQIPYLDSSG